MAKDNSENLKEFTFGTCRYESVRPARETLSAETKVLNVIVPFEEALKLYVALNEGILKINRYNRNTTAGKRAAINLTIHLHADRIAVNEGKLRKDN